MSSVKQIKILAIGDIVGRTGRSILKVKLQGIKEIHKVDVVIANGENVAGGLTITPGKMDELFSMGIDVITTGNHVWDKKDILEVIDNEINLIRPANYPDYNKGRGYIIINCKGINICVINLQGRIHMEPIDNPFMKFDEIYSEIHNKSDIVIVDFHAEATAEKKAMGWYLDGRVSAVFGTHTHVQTADECILPKGTGYITDLGMTGSFDSVIGMEKEQSIMRFLTGTKVRFKAAKGCPGINGIFLTISKKGITTEILRLNDINYNE